MTFEVWREGYNAQGNRDRAQFLGTADGATFYEACDALLSDDPSYSRERMTVWVCRLFDNEADARKAFG